MVIISYNDKFILIIIYITTFLLLNHLQFLGAEINEPSLSSDSTPSESQNSAFHSGNETTETQLPSIRIRPVVQVPISTEPFNEFEANDELLYACFPHLFLLGKGLLQKGSVPTKAIRHMMFQFPGLIAANLRLIFCLFNQLQRHAVSRSVAAKVKTNPDSFTEFAKWVADPSFLEQLRKAQKNPKSKEAQELLKLIRPHISVYDSKIPFSIAQRTSSMGHLYALYYHFGLPSAFHTFSLDDLHGVLNLR